MQVIVSRGSRAADTRVDSCPSFYISPAGPSYLLPRLGGHFTPFVRHPLSPPPFIQNSEKKGERDTFSRRCLGNIQRVNIPCGSSNCVPARLSSCPLVCIYFDRVYIYIYMVGEITLRLLVQGQPSASPAASAIVVSCLFFFSLKGTRNILLIFFFFCFQFFQLLEKTKIAACRTG